MPQRVDGRTLRLDLEFDGTDFRAGSGRPAGAPSRRCSRRRWRASSGARARRRRRADRCRRPRPRTWSPRTRSRRMAADEIAAGSGRRAPAGGRRRARRARGGAGLPRPPGRPVEVVPLRHPARLPSGRPLRRRTTGPALGRRCDDAPRGPDGRAAARASRLRAPSPISARRPGVHRADPERPVRWTPGEDTAAPRRRRGRIPLQDGAHAGRDDGAAGQAPRRGRPRAGRRCASSRRATGPVGGPVAPARGLCLMAVGLARATAPGRVPAILLPDRRRLGRARPPGGTLLKIIISGRHVGVTDSMKDVRADEGREAAAVLRSRDQLPRDHGRGHLDHLVEMVLNVSRGVRLVGKAEAPDMYAAVRPRRAEARRSSCGGTRNA